MHRLRSSLHSKKLARYPILRPFDIHGQAVMVFYNAGPPGQSQDFFVAQRELPLPRNRDLPLLRSSAIALVDQFLLLRPQLLFHNGFEAFLQCRFENVELVRTHYPLRQVLAQTIGSSHVDHIPEARFCIYGECDARAG